MYQWKKDVATWKINKTLYISVPFTWLLPKAKGIAISHNGVVVAGGPAVDLIPDYLNGVAEIGKESPIPPLSFHNPCATFTTRGCPNSCPFCAVPKTEGVFKELKDWPVRPIVCDNNFLAASFKHISGAIHNLSTFEYVDFNQGLEARLFKGTVVDEFRNLKCVKIRFAFDSWSDEKAVTEAIKTARNAGFKDIGVYVLIGFNDKPESSRERLEYIRSLGLRPNPMRFQPLDALIKNSFVADGWTESELRKMMKYYSRLRWLEHIPYGEFRESELPLFKGSVV